MLNTYKAVLKGDRLEWSDDVPDLLVPGQPVPVHVTILDPSMPPSEQPRRGEHMAAALERLAAMGGLTEIANPTTWQRELRQDRSLPGRDT